jgi:lysosomal alpha-glucosidase
MHTNPDAEGDVDEDLEQLVVVPRRRHQNPWGGLLRIVMVVLLMAAVISIACLIGREYYLLSRQKEMFNDFLEFEAADDSYEDGKNQFSADMSSDTCDINVDWRFDCHPEDGASEEKCRHRNCCWIPQPQAGEPFCFYRKDLAYYKWSNATETTFGLQASAILIRSSPYPADVKELTVHVIYETEGSVRIKIFDPNNSRFEVPLPYKIYDESSKKSPNPKYYLKFFDNGFQVFRYGFATPLFDTTVAPMVYADQFLQLSSALPSNYIYGLGETQDKLSRSLNWSRSVLWTHDSVPTENRNLYSSHPFYFVMEKSGASHGVFLANSNAMEVILQPGPAVTFRTIGGILDFHYFVGPTPQEVMDQYTNIIGKPAIPPYWSLGFHLCRFNYGTLNHTRKILENNIKAGIPIDVQWNDLDYMHNQNDFTYDKIKFGDLPEFVKYLHDNGMHYVPLIDAGISGGEAVGSYSPYDDGINMNVFIMDSEGKKPFVGKVWNPKSTVWPDFSHPNVTEYWRNQFEKLYNEVPIDGAWLDMNEPSNFWNGGAKGCDKASTLDNPPYVPHVEGGELAFKTICPSAIQSAGRHYDLHNLFGTLETIATSKTLADLRSERQFIISRSTFPGQGHFGGHWTGDVSSTWEDMRKSIPQVLTFGLFGIPLVGADICGFNGNTTVDLCKRWMQLGAFYPFSRNHNTDDGIPQDPASLGQEVIDASKATLKVRYSLLPYIMSLFFNSYFTGEPVARPMFYEFPKDINTYMIETQFMLGSAVLVVPILEENYTAKTIKAYLPSGWWYQHHFSEIVDSLGEERELKIPKDSIPVLYRGGSIIVKQEPGQTTTASRKNKYHIHVYLSKYGNASGELYWDDGIVPATTILGKYSHFNLTASRNSLNMVTTRLGNEDLMVLGSVEIRGVMGSVSSVLLNNVEFAYNMSTQNRTLQVNNLNMTMMDGIQVVWKP